MTTSQTARAGGWEGFPARVTDGGNDDGFKEVEDGPPRGTEGREEASRGDTGTQPEGAEQEDAADRAAAGDARRSAAWGALAAAMSEAELEENIRDTCKKLGILRFHVRISKGTTAGLPDDILIGPRGILWRECKNATYKPTPAQVKTGEALTAVGQDFAIWRPADWYSGRIVRELRGISRMTARAA